MPPPLLVLLATASRLNDEDVVQVNVKGMSFGPGQSPLMDLAVRNGGEWSSGIPQNVVNSLSRQLHIECVFGRHHSLGNALQRSRALGNPFLHLEWIGMNGADVHSRGLGPAEQHMEG